MEDTPQPPELVVRAHARDLDGAIGCLYGMQDWLSAGREIPPSAGVLFWVPWIIELVAELRQQALESEGPCADSGCRNCACDEYDARARIERVNEDVGTLSRAVNTNATEIRRLSLWCTDIQRQIERKADR